MDYRAPVSLAVNVKKQRSFAGFKGRVIRVKGSEVAKYVVEMIEGPKVGEKREVFAEECERAAETEPEGAPPPGQAAACTGAPG